jgi:uncharacterized protein YkwD
LIGELKMRRQIATVLGGLVFAATMFTTATVGGSPAQAAGCTVGASAALENDLLAYHNLERTSRGLAPLTREPRADQHAREVAAWLNGADADRNLNPPAHALFSASWQSWYGDYRGAGENLYLTGTDATSGDLTAGWMASAGHRSSILSPGFDAVGFGTYVTADGMMYTAAHFIDYDGLNEGSLGADPLPFPSAYSARGAGATCALLVTSPPPGGVDPAPTSASRLVAVNPERLLDTRPGSGPIGYSGGRPGRNALLRVPIVGRAGVPANAVAVSLNVTMTDSARAGYVSVVPSGARTDQTSNLNVIAGGQTVANAVTVKLGSDGAIDVFADQGGHLIVDIVGYYAPVNGAVSGGRLQTVNPLRLLDTRPGAGPLGYRGSKPVAGQVVSLPVLGKAGVPSSGVAAVALNVTMTDASSAGFVTVWAGGGPRPATSSVNAGVAGQTVANHVVAQVGADGTIQLFTEQGTHLIVDIAGWFTSDGVAASTSGLFRAVTPNRVLDTRQGGAPTRGAQLSVRVGGLAGVPSSGVSAIAANVTYVGAAAPGYVTMWPAGSGVPNVSTLNASRIGDTVPNAAISPVGSGSSVSFFTETGGHLLLDITGYYSS